MSFDDRQPSTESELERYLNDKEKRLEMLDKYPNIKKLFMRYNTMLPSSAPVERLFSMAALVLTGKRANLSDTLLEHLILLKIYRNLWNTYWIIFELFLNYFQFIFEFWINSNWINSFEKIELKIESESWINSMLIELCKHWEEEYIGLDNGMGEDICDMETQPITYIAAATSKGKGKAILPKVVPTAQLSQLPAVPAGLLNKNRAIMPPPSSAPSKTQYIPVGTAASEVPAGVLRRTSIEYGIICFFIVLC